MEKNNTQIVPVKELLNSPSVREKFEELFGEKGKERQPKTTAFILSIINVVSKSEQLAKADRNSILFASATGATVNLPINDNLGYAYIVPFYDGKSKTFKAQFQIGYKGLIQLAQRNKDLLTAHATKVVEGEIKETNRLTGEIKFEWIQDQDERNKKPVVGYVAYFKLKNGFEKYLYMTISELKAHGLKYSQSFKRGYGQWEDNFEAMALKTVLKLLLSKYAPLSIEDKAMETALIADQATGENEYPDNKPLSLDEVQKEKELNRIKAWIAEAQDKEKLSEVNQYVYESGDEELIGLYEDRLNELDVEISA